MNIDASNGNGPDTLTVSLSSPLFDVLDYQVEHHDDVLDLIDTLRNYRGHIDAEIETAVGRARASGLPWERIGAVLGVSRQAAWERYGG